MNLILKSRGPDLNDRLRGYATDRFTKVQRFFDRIMQMEVELSEERNPRVKDPYRADATVKTPKETLRAHGSGSDHYAAIDQAADRLEQQVKKLKERRIDRTHRGGNDASGKAAAKGRGEEDEGPVVVQVPMSLTKPLNVEEAVFELDDRGLQFLLFTNAGTMTPSVLYRRGDGTYGLIEHES